MRVVILAGGLGTRLSEETDIRPKPMVEIGARPILWHIMKIYSHYGHNDFVICLGYKGYFIKEYFHHYYMHQADMTIDLSTNSTTYNNASSEPWRVTLVDTGMNSGTGGRLRRVKGYLGDETFMLTYGDGVSDVDLDDLLSWHRKSGRAATLTAVQPKGKFGALSLSADGTITSFQEKPKGDGAWVSGGFFVLEPRVFDHIPESDEAIWEREPLESLARRGELGAFRHVGFWHPMDTLKDRNDLEGLWQTGRAPWKVWT